MDKRDTWKLTIVSLMVMPILVQAKEKSVTKVADNTPVLPEIAVTAPVEAPGYSPPYTSTATKSTIPIFDSPFSVQVIPEQVFSMGCEYILCPATTHGHSPLSRGATICRVLIALPCR